MRSPLAAALSLLLLSGVAFADRDGGRDGREGRDERRAHPARPRVVTHPAAPAVVIKMHRVPVPHTPAIKDPNHVVRDQRRIDLPRQDGHGAPIVKHAETRPPVQHSEIVHDRRVVRGIEDQQRGEREVGRHYWHEDHGVQYSHYYDGHAHWYGFYHGPNFYWTRYHANRWWWYDTAYSRWVYWGDGFWWWPGPAGVPYVYMDGTYYPYEQGTVVVKKPELQTPVAEAPAPGVGVSTVSADGRRSVVIAGYNAEAFLYDKSEDLPLFLKYLGTGVASVRFSGGTNGQPLEILVQFLDGTFALYDGDGNPKDAAAASGAAAAEPPADAPDSIPPPPASAPGK